jgi:Tol biopolymer transport system component
MKRSLLLIISIAVALTGTAQPTDANRVMEPPVYTEATHLANVKQLTWGGDNAEAYFSFDDKHLSTQVTNPAWGLSCDQIFDFDIAKAEKDSTYRPPLISTGKGRTTCSFFLPDGKHILYASTHLGADTCPPKPAPRADHKYLWPVYSDFDIFVADLKGNITKRLTSTPGYDAEATVSPDGKKIVFTSMRSGDLEVYTMDIDGSHVKQITHELGYDGGAFFSPDSRKIVFRASRPTTPEEIKEYKDFLAQGLVAPTHMELYTCNADGSDMKQVTHLGKANWAPYFTPDGRKIIFSSNHASSRGYDFQLYTINLDGTGIERITTESNFNAFPMFSHDGKKLIWSSNRDNHGAAHGIDLFIADWK